MMIFKFLEVVFLWELKICLFLADFILKKWRQRGIIAFARGDMKIRKLRVLQNWLFLMRRLKSCPYIQASVSVAAGEECTLGTYAMPNS
jgi:hypothetical protein